MPSIYIRPASTATDDGLRLLQNFDSQLPWLSSIGSSAQWGGSSRSEQEDQRAKYRSKVESSERGWNNPWSRDWVRAYIAEVEMKREDLSSELLELAIESPNDAVRLPVAGMILQGQSAEYARDILPENDDNDPFIYLLYLLSDRRTAPYGKGAGAALISHAKDEARNLGLRRICLDCWRGNDNKLVHYYEKQGFRVIGNFDADNWPGAVMEMRL
ncbi:hypothetical protein A1O1_08262 [Capronia coronata CBS 617.96]|uniref:N-acetyltransferase domain-containing protein n=1 Tax=Capronia coronata CBS 617.96 TaxID=1182541 RepID=W9XS06_9EURO|nr:uncharacterized protein A1O1_08262 [Capronia coronata CBS 617.96]EXJ80120.1 hypothetical protein A1O1_08262 [Capronia coronata CBS 617.96]